jgi:hypothetical protein
MIEWHPYFAWLPVVLEDGRFAWLRWVECRMSPLVWDFREPGAQ